MGINGDLDDVAKDMSRSDHSCVGEADLCDRILHVLNNLFFHIYGIIAAIRINDDFHIVGLAEMVLAGSEKGVLDGLQQCVLTDVVLFFEYVHRFHQFLVHFLSSLLKIECQTN